MVLLWIFTGLVQAAVLPVVIYMVLQMREPTWRELQDEEPVEQVSWWRLLVVGAAAFGIGVLGTLFVEMVLEYYDGSVNVDRRSWFRCWRVLIQIVMWSGFLACFPAYRVMRRSFYGRKRVWCVVLAAVFLPFVHVATVFPECREPAWKGMRTEKSMRMCE